MRDKLDPKRERKRHFDAYLVYRDLGSGRSFRKVARQVQAAPISVGRWAKLYNWDGRVAKHNTAVAEKQKVGAILKVDDPIAKKLVDAMDRVEALIDGAFIHEADGGLIPRIEIKHVEELTRLIAEYRKFLETYHNFVETHMPQDKETKRGTTIKEMNVHFGNMPQEDRIDVLKGLTHGNDTGGNKPAPGRVSDADSTEVSGRGDEDGHGRDGVSGSSASGDSGDKKTVRKS